MLNSLKSGGHETSRDRETNRTQIEDKLPLIKMKETDARGTPQNFNRTPSCNSRPGRGTSTFPKFGPGAPLT